MSVKTKLFKHQREAKRFALGRRSAALFMEQGTGKTLVALSVIDARWTLGKLCPNTVLIVAPRNVVPVWSRQIAQHLADDHEIYAGRRDLGRLLGMRKRFDTGSQRIRFLIINYETLWRKKSWFLRQTWGMIVADESHRLKHRSSRQSSALASLSRTSKYKLLMTGTPISQGMIDLWSQFRFMNSSILGERWKDFARVWCQRSGYMGYKRKVKKWKIPALTEILHRHSYRITLSEARPNMPSALDQEMIVSLDKRIKKHYIELEQEMRTQVAEETITTELAITQMLRLHQLTGGFLTTDDGNLAFLGSSKYDALHEALEDWRERREPDDKAVIFCKFTAEVRSVCKMLLNMSERFDYFDGSHNDPSIWQDFQDRPDTRVLVVQIETGGVGIDLYRANLGIFFSVGLNYVDYDQARARLRRIGQEKTVLYLHIMMEDTIDMRIRDSLQSKGNLAHEVLDTYRKTGEVTMAKTATAKKSKSKVAKEEVAETDAKTPAASTAKSDSAYNVDAMAAELGLTAFTVRMKLRTAGIEKSGRTYSWSSKKEFQAALAKVRGTKLKNEKSSSGDE